MTDLKICRVCLNTNVRGFPFESHNIQRDYENVTGIKVSAKDALPQWACYECATLLHKYHKFKEKCLHGQNILQRIVALEPISYKRIEFINRISEGLHSQITLVIAHDHTKTFSFKHETKKKIEKKSSLAPRIIFNDDDIIKEDVEEKVELITEPEQVVDVTYEKKELDVKIKSEPSITEEQLRDVDDDISMDVDDDIAIDNNISDIPLDNNMSDEDENIFLDIVKKAVNGENQLVFLDGVKEEHKKQKKTGKSKQKFMKRKKEYLNMEYWKMYKLTDEEALVEFKRKESSDKYLKANYKCHNCFKGFSKLEMLMRHVKMRHDESLGELECRFCRMRFKLKCMLSKHMLQHYTLYDCLRCDMRFSLQNSAIFHEDWHNGVIRKCKHCGDEFKHSSTYYTHMRVAHRSSHICSLCGASFVSSAGLAQHSRIKHAHAEVPTESTDSTIHCEKCNLKFVSQEAYDLHLSHSNMHEDGLESSAKHRANGKERGAPRKPRRAKKPTTCIHCGKHFNTQAACMKHHLAEHPRKTFYSADQRHICEVCGASLAAVSIASHMNRHTREHVYACDTCGMQFVSKSSHHRHQVTHTGERPYPCPLCDKRFTQKNSMQLHYRTFHLKQPYPKRNRKRKTDEMPIMESCRERDEADPALLARWRLSQ